MKSSTLYTKDTVVKVTVWKTAGKDKENEYIENGR
jgi:hypothetical protein